MEAHTAGGYSRLPGLQTKQLSLGFFIMRWRFFFLLLLSGVLLACNPDKNRKVDQATISFKTNDASKLFFKNLRQSYYDKEEMEAAKLEIYRLRKRNQSLKHPVVNLAIVNNWRFDEAYLLLEPNGLLTLDSLIISWKNAENGTNGTIEFENGNKKAIVKFADQIYDQIQQGSEFSVFLEGKAWDILKSSEDREAFRITMMDYYRLAQRL
jgi:hypothetical protein